MKAVLSPMPPVGELEGGRPYWFLVVVFAWDGILDPSYIEDALRVAQWVVACG
jgi:hypothetical protein